MRSLRARLDEGFAAAAAVARALEPGEAAHTFLCGTGQRRLAIDASGGRRLRVEEGGFGGFIRLRSADRQLYLHVPEANPQDLPNLLAAARTMVHLGGAPPSPDAQPLHGPAPEGWENTRDRLDLQSVADDPDPIHAAIGAALHPEQSLHGVQVADLLSETVVVGDGEDRHWSRCYGVEVHAVAVGAGGARPVSLSRYAATLDAIDLAGMGRELGLVAAGSAPPELDFTAEDVVLTPYAASQFVRHVTGTLLLNPPAEPVPLCAPLVDDGRAEHGYLARGHDCEGTATGRIDIVSRDGRHQQLATRHLVSRGRTPAARLTGHARWDAMRNFPQLSATNVAFAHDGVTTDLLTGDRCVVVDVHSLGVDIHRSAGHLALRLRAARVLDGKPVGAYRPVAVAGDVADFLTAVRAVGPVVSYFPGTLCAGGSYLALNLSALVLRR